jgi:MoxR-like ATPase
MDELNDFTTLWSPDDALNNEIEYVSRTSQLIKNQIHRVIVGKDDLIEQLFMTLLAEGHVLLEGNPGIAKTHIAKLFALTLGCKFNRQQFTPDLLPADVIGSYVFDQKSGEFYVRKGGIFANIVMVDEVNRATPRTQSALLESMEERAVTIEGTTFPLELPFMLIATESPFGFEGTYPLPEVQLDRFTIKAKVGYPDSDEELEIIELRGGAEEDIDSVTDREALMRMIVAVREIYVDAKVKRYIRDLVVSTRMRPDLRLSASPRASIAFLRLSKALAAIRRRDYVLPDDVKAVAPLVLGHRLVLAHDAELEGVTTETIIQKIMSSVDTGVVNVAVPY